MVCGVWGLAHFLLKEYFIQHNCADIISAGFLLVRKDKSLIFLRPQGLFISTETKAGPQFTDLRPTYSARDPPLWHVHAYLRFDNGVNIGRTLSASTVTGGLQCHRFRSHLPTW
jgi:hypothetical protein